MRTASLLLILVSSLPVFGETSRVDKPNRPPLYVSFTMDCERIAQECSAGGPKTWALSERAIRGFCETLLAAGLPPTLFVVPETGERHQDLLRSLHER